MYSHIFQIIQQKIVYIRINTDKKPDKIIEVINSVGYVHPHLSLLAHSDASQISSPTMHISGAHQPELWILPAGSRT